MFKALKYMKIASIVQRNCSAIAEKAVETSVKKVEKPSISTRAKNITYKIGNYFLKIGKDYQMVAKDIATDMKEAPIKSSVYLSLLSCTIYLMNTNPSEAQFKSQVIEYSIELCSIGDLVRSRQSDDHIQSLLRAYNYGVVRRLNLGVVSLIWLDDYAKECDVYSAKCKPSRVRWMDVFGLGDMKTRIVDIGIAGRYRLLDEAIVDFDVNDSEWSQQEKWSRQFYLRN